MYENHTAFFGDIIIGGGGFSLSIRTPERGVLEILSPRFSTVSSAGRYCTKLQSSQGSSIQAYPLPQGFPLVRLQ